MTPIETALAETAIDATLDALADARAQLDAAEKRVEELTAWQLAVAEGTGYVNRAEGQGGYAVARASVILESWNRMAREHGDGYAEAIENERHRADEAETDLADMTKVAKEALARVDELMGMMEIEKAAHDAARLLMLDAEHMRNEEKAAHAETRALLRAEQAASSSEEERQRAETAEAEVCHLHRECGAMAVDLAATFARAEAAERKAFFAQLDDSKRAELAQALLDVASLTARAESAEKDRDEARSVLQKISDIRDSIVGLQGFNWSEHAYPLVAVLGKAGFVGAGHAIASKNIGTLIERCNAAERLAATAAERQREALKCAIEDAHARGMNYDFSEGNPLRARRALVDELLEEYAPLAASPGCICPSPGIHRELAALSGREPSREFCVATSPGPDWQAVAECEHRFAPDAYGGAPDVYGGACLRCGGRYPFEAAKKSTPVGAMECEPPCSHCGDPVGPRQGCRCGRNGLVTP